MYTVKNIKFEDRDDYGRLKIAKRILDVIQKNGNSPIFIDGAWGAGKSEFCYKLFHFLKDSPQDSYQDEKSEDNPKLTVAYINSFAGDYLSNPFMLIVQAIYNSLITEEAPPTEIEWIQEKLSKGMSFARTLFVAGFRGTSLKISPPLTGIELGVKGGDIVDAVKKDTEKFKEEFKVAFFDELESFRQQSKQLMQFKNAINDAMGGRKIVLIIDELDRCRPDYALELLENIKHIFEIKDLFIIFSANKKQLEAIIHKKYGYGVDAEGYLEKFYNESILLTSVVPIKELDKDHGFSGHLTVFSDVLDGCGSNCRVDFRVVPFMRELLGTLETRKLERVAENLHNYFVSTGERIDSLSATQLSFIVLGVYLVVQKPEILREIENNLAQHKLREYFNKLSIGEAALQGLTGYLDMDLDNIGATREDFIYGRKVPSVIIKVRDILM